MLPNNETIHSPVFFSVGMPRHHPQTSSANPLKVRALDLAADEGKSEPESQSLAYAPRQLRIVIADGDPESLKLLRLALKSPANNIYEATNGVELVQLLVENDPFDLVVTDVILPWMDGLEVLRSVRATEVATPVLMITRLVRSDLQAKVDHLGNAKLLHKPFGIPELRAAVFDLMDRQRLS
jgi:CheY-like chemotaxis protein